MNEKRPIVLSEEELLILIREARRETPLDVAFGGRLLPVPGNDWAFKRVEEMRAENAKA